MGKILLLLAGVEVKAEGTMCRRKVWASSIRAEDEVTVGTLGGSQGLLMSFFSEGVKTAE